jgi:hypothetical protein
MSVMMTISVSNILASNARPIYRPRNCSGVILRSLTGFFRYRHLFKNIPLYFFPPIQSRGVDGRKSFPHEHCVWNCRMVRYAGISFALNNSSLKEEIDNHIADKRDEIKDAGCWNSRLLPDFFKMLFESHSCSAGQNADWQDNATGRNCALGCTSNFNSYSDGQCEECCTKMGVGTETQDGPGTNRPYGPRCEEPEWAEKAKM